jgi:hypothetical protein
VTAAVALLGILPVACKHDIDRRRVFVRDEGAVCFGPAVDVDAAAPQNVDLAADQKLSVSVRSGVLSDMCATQRTSTCAVKREGDRLVVTSELSWLAPGELDVKCRGPTSILEARCATDSLPAGSYRVVLGSRTIDVTLPSHREESCVGLPNTPKVAVATAVADAAPPPGATGTLLVLDPNTVPAVPGTGVIAEPPPGDTLCIAPLTATKNRALKAGAPIAITVLHKNACVGASCSTAPAKCKVKRTGTHIVLNAAFPSPTTKPAHPCSEDCTALAVTCRTDALPAGTYTIELGAQHKTLQVPSPVAPPCGP